MLSLSACQVLHLQRKYNRSFPAIYGTYQCYLQVCLLLLSLCLQQWGVVQDTHSRLLVDLERAKREKFVFAAKIVRGPSLSVLRRLPQVSAGWLAVQVPTWCRSGSERRT